MKFYIYNDTLGFINIFGTRIEQGPGHDLKTVVLFYKDDKLHNTKNAAYISDDGKKGFFFK